MTTKVQRRSHKSKSNKSRKRSHRNKKTKKSKRHLKNIKGGKDPRLEYPECSNPPPYSDDAYGRFKVYSENEDDRKHTWFEFVMPKPNKDENYNVRVKSIRGIEQINAVINNPSYEDIQYGLNTDFICVEYKENFAEL